MITYPLDYNPIREYWQKIESREEIVSKKIYDTYKKLNIDLDSNASEWYYEPKRANHLRSIKRVEINALS